MHPRVISPFAVKRHAQQGMVLLYTLVGLVVLLLGGAALVRAMDSSLMQAGNMAYQRDLINQAQRAIVTAQAAITSGSLSTEAARSANLVSANYSASRLASNGQGIPNVLLSDTAYTSAGYTVADITDNDTKVTLRYVIDRQCSAAGAYDSDSITCVTVRDQDAKSADAYQRQINGESRPVYRITVRAMGPHNSLAFFQTSVSL